MFYQLGTNLTQRVIKRNIPIGPCQSVIKESPIKPKDSSEETIPTRRYQSFINEAPTKPNESPKKPS